LLLPWLAAALLGLGAATAAAQQMSLPGKFDVSSGGAATYSIPIAVPPGTAGMVPDLALTYSSHGANGIVGVGWSLFGLASISRCPQTFVQDGVRGGITFTGTDRFCLDGQRLIAISGTYGADGAEYRTEIDGFSRIISHGTAGTGPAWFEVHTKSGQIMQFGNTIDSQVLAQGKTTARNWAVNKVSDTKGNYFTVTYTNDTTNGQAYPIRIDYTGNTAAGLSPYNDVQFIYATRPDIAPAYQAGSLVNMTVRLTDVKTYTGTTLVADYQLGYQQGTDTRRSHVSSIEVCGSDGVTCMPATNFAWTDGPTNSFAASNVTAPGESMPYFGDFNGDGKTDILWCMPNSNGWCVAPSPLWISNGDGTFTVTNLTNPNLFVPYLGDFNGDGKTDILWCNPYGPGYLGCYDGTANSTSNLQLWTSNGNGTFSSTNINSSLAGYKPYLGDFNGDGKTDILWCNVFNGSGWCSSSSPIWMSNGDGTFASGNLTVPNTYIPFLGDFNGDGKTDILWCNPYGAGCYAAANSSANPQLWTSNGDGTFATSTLNSTLYAYAPYLGDFNGDGKTDVLWCNADIHGWCYTNSVLWMSKGDGTFVPITIANPSQYVPYPADFNGDGKTDILWCNPYGGGCYGVANSTANPQLWVSNGDGTFATGLMNSTLYEYHSYLGDFNGDGRTDILWCNAYSQGWCAAQAVLWSWNGGTAATDLVSTTTTGLGATTSITYQPLTKSTVYTKDTNASYPLQDVQSPMYVVSRVDTANGIGSNYSTTYGYTGAKADLSGRGFLGFRQATATDLQTNVVHTSNFRQDYPYIGLTASETKVLGTAILNSVSNTYQFKNASGVASVSTPSNTSAPYRVSVSASSAASSDLNGAAMPTVTTTSQYDSYGNPTQVVTSTPDGFSKTTTNTYTNDTTNWFLGRLTGATVTSTTP